MMLCLYIGVLFYLMDPPKERSSQKPHHMVWLKIIRPVAGFGVFFTLEPQPFEQIFGQLNLINGP